MQSVKKWTTILGICASLGVPSIASATLITATFAGPVTFVHDDLGTTIEAADLFSVQFTFNSNLGDVDLDPEPDIGKYGPVTATIGIGALEWTSTDSNIFVINDRPVGSLLADRYMVFGTLTGPSLGGLPAVAYSVYLRDTFSSGTPLISTALPLDDSLLKEFDPTNEHQIYMRFSDFNGPIINSRLELISVSQVPEPATLALFGIGLAGLGFGRRKVAQS